MRVLPEWDTDIFTVYAVYPARHLLPAKTRTFVDWLVDYFQTNATWDDGTAPQRTRRKSHGKPGNRLRVPR